MNTAPTTAEPLTAGKPLRRRPILPAELPIEAVTAIQDSREQCPLTLDPLRVEIGTLQTADYSIKGLESVVAVERKSLPDLLGCVGTDRERFDREIMRLAAYPCRVLVVESDWPEIEAGDWRQKVTSSAVVGSLLGWAASGITILMAGNHERAGRYVSRLLYTCARRRWRENRALLSGWESTNEPEASNV